MTDAYTEYEYTYVYHPGATDRWYRIQPTGITTQYWDHFIDNCSTPHHLRTRVHVYSSIAIPWYS